MWWCRFFALGVVVALLGACGFRPIYGTNPGVGRDVADELAQVRIEPIADRVGQQLRNNLVESFGIGAGNPPTRYILKITLNESVQKLAVQRDQLATRANYQLQATYTLSDGSGQLHRASHRVISSYNILSSDFSNLTAETEARTRAAREVGDAIRTSLSAYFSGRSGGQTSQVR